jgi:hypothetical protein
MLHCEVVWQPAGFVIRLFWHSWFENPASPVAALRLASQFKSPDPGSHPMLRLSLCFSLPPFLLS